MDHTSLGSCASGTTPFSAAILRNTSACRNTSLPLSIALQNYPLSQTSQMAFIRGAICRNTSASWNTSLPLSIALQFVFFFFKSIDCHASLEEYTSLPEHRLASLFFSDHPNGIHHCTDESSGLRSGGICQIVQIHLSDE